VTLHTRLERVFRLILGRDELVLTDDLGSADVPGWASLDHVSLLLAIEEEFDVRFTADEIVSAQSVREIKRIIRSRAPGDVVEPGTDDS
jgi:acyl carrier protein